MVRLRERLGWGVALAAILALLAVVAGVVRAGPLDPPGAPGSTPGVRLPGTPITQPASFPIQISQPGSYYLAENITGVPAENGIEILGDNVTLDLNGFTVTGVPGSIDGITVGVANNVVVRNGTVTAWAGSGLSATGTSHGLIEDIIASNNGDNGINFGMSYSVLRNCQAYGNAQIGAEIFSTSSLVEHCTFSNNTGQGAKIDGNENRIVDNAAMKNGLGLTGFWITGTGNQIEHNSAMSNGLYGFWFDGPNTTAVANIASLNQNVNGSAYNVTNGCTNCLIAPIMKMPVGAAYWSNLTD